MTGSSAGPRIFVSAGEPSGDRHGARLVEALRSRFPTATIEAFGGPKMAEAGAVVRDRMEGFTALGFVEVVEKIPRHWRLLQALRARFRGGAYHLVILIDYPGFHLRVAEAARAAGIPVLYYIAPQLWAWNPGRARRFAAAVDGLAAILPFEPAFFTGIGVAAEFVGHPLNDGLPLPREVARATLGAATTERILALFPGSRDGELRRLWPAFRDAACRLLADRRCDRVIAAATADGGYPDPGPVEVWRGDPAVVFAAADAALAKSGTTTLEAALADLPMVVAYRVHPLTAVLARRLLRVPWISLVNLVAGDQVVPELVQDQANGERLAAEVAPLLDPQHPAAARQRQGLAEVRKRLGGPGAAERVAAMAERWLAQ